MEPVKFKGHNTVIAEDQEEYRSLPACVQGDYVVSCWKLTFMEKVKIFFTGRLYLTIMTFKQPLQPQLPSINSPVVIKEHGEPA